MRDIKFFAGHKIFCQSMGCALCNANFAKLSKQAVC